MKSIEEYCQFVRGLVAKQGPFPEDDAEVQQVADALFADILAHRLGSVDVLELRRNFGHALDSCATLQGHALAKPYGYPGDFELFDKIYTHHVNPDPRYVRWDEFFHRLDAPTAVRNRKAWLVHLLQQKHDASQRPLRVLIVGSGPGRDVWEFLQSRPGGAYFDCVELDPRGIEYAQHLCHSVLSHVRFHQGSILRFKTDTRYDVIWSGGLFDYFNDRLFVRALIQLSHLLVAGGELIIGNFAANSSRGFMELVSDWKLTLRTPEALHRLASTAGASTENIRIDREPIGVNLFLRVTTQDTNAPPATAD